MADERDAQQRLVGAVEHPPHRRQRLVVGLNLNVLAGHRLTAADALPPPRKESPTHAVNAVGIRAGGSRHTATSVRIEGSS
jgi:hypothetical protein